MVRAADTSQDYLLGLLRSGKVKAPGQDSDGASRDTEMAELRQANEEMRREMAELRGFMAGQQSVGNEKSRTRRKATEED
jgi:hypothetical protein